MNAYLDYNPDVFRGKTILLPCDDPEWSNFTKFFALHFQDYGIKKLISTSYAPKSNMEGQFYTPEPSLFNSDKYDKDKDFERGKIFILDGTDTNDDGRVNINDFTWEYLEGDGDFRSDEITALRDEADMVITNPPFSLFREFVAWLVEGDVEFSVIGNKNAITYKEIFPLIKENKMWLGNGFSRGDAYFRIPEQMKREFSNGVYDEKTNLVHFRNTDWFTNIQHGRRHEPLPLMNMDDNLRFNKRINKNPNSYKKYDNYDAIEIPFTSGIPSDYEGVMGVPISFLDKYCPEQFEILGSRRWGKSQELLDVYTGDIVPAENDKKTLIDGKETYDRIFIRHLNPETNKE